MELCPIVLTLVFQLIIILELYENCIKHDGVAELIFMKTVFSLILSLGGPNHPPELNNECAV